MNLNEAIIATRAASEAFRAHGEAAEAFAKALGYSDGRIELEYNDDNSPGVVTVTAISHARCGCCGDEETWYDINISDLADKQSAVKAAQQILSEREAKAARELAAERARKEREQEDRDRRELARLQSKYGS